MHSLLTRRKDPPAPPPESELPADVFTLNEGASPEQIEWVARFERERGRQAYERAEQLESRAARARGQSVSV